MGAVITIDELGSRVRCFVVFVVTVELVIVTVVATRRLSVLDVFR